MIALVSSAFRIFALGSSCSQSTPDTLKLGPAGRAGAPSFSLPHGFVSSWLCAGQSMDLEARDEHEAKPLLGSGLAAL